MQYVADCFVSQIVCNETTLENLYALRYVPDCFETHKMCNEEWKLRDVSNHFNKKMSENIVERKMGLFDMVLIFIKSKNCVKDLLKKELVQDPRDIKKCCSRSPELSLEYVSDH